MIIYTYISIIILRIYIYKDLSSIKFNEKKYSYLLEYLLLFIFKNKLLSFNYFMAIFIRIQIII